MSRIVGFEPNTSGQQPVDNIGIPISVGVWGDSDTGVGVFSTSTSSFPSILGRGVNMTGVQGETQSPDHPAVAGRSGLSTGVLGATGSRDAHGVVGSNTGGGDAILGLAGDGRGVVGASRRGGTGVFGENDGEGTGVYGFSPQGHGVRGESVSTTGSGVRGTNAGGGTGVYGFSPQGYGVMGESASTAGVKGLNLGTGPGVVALNKSGNALISLSSQGSAGLFVGDVDVLGELYATSKYFIIDHPVDPANKYLVHAGVESSERANVYSGNAILDDNGEAWVLLPEWVEALNEDFRYQLTCIGRFASVYVAKEVSENHFLIAGGDAKMKVSWQVTGVRKDVWAKAHPLVVEKEKSAEEQGHYRHPELFGQDLEGSTHWARNPELAGQLQRSHPELLQQLNQRLSQRNTPTA